MAMAQKMSGILSNGKKWHDDGEMLYIDHDDVSTVWPLMTEGEKDEIKAISAAIRVTRAKARACAEAYVDKLWDRDDDRIEELGDMEFKKFYQAVADDPDLKLIDRDGDPIDDGSGSAKRYAIEEAYHMIHIRLYEED